jgi:outer membrane protein
MTLLRNILAALVLAGVTLASTANAQRATANNSARPDARATRVAVFNSRLVFDSMPERSRAESELALAQAQARVTLESAKDSLRAAVDDLARFEQTMSMREREAMTLHLRARELLVEETVARLDQEVQRTFSTLRQPMIERLRQAMRVVRDREGYDLLLDVADDGVLRDAAPAIDLTAAILRELRNPVADAQRRR